MSFLPRISPVSPILPQEPLGLGIQQCSPLHPLHPCVPTSVFSSTLWGLFHLLCDLPVAACGHGQPAASWSRGGDSRNRAMRVPVSKTFPNILKQKQIPLQTRPSQPFPPGQTPLSSLPRLQHPVTSAPVSHLPAADFQCLALLSPSRQAGRFPSSTTVGVTLSQRAFFSRHDELSVTSRSHPARISSSRDCLPWKKKTNNVFDFKEQKCAGRSFFLWIRQVAKIMYKLPGFL